MFIINKSSISLYISCLLLFLFGHSLNGVIVSLSLYKCGKTNILLLGDSHVSQEVDMLMQHDAKHNDIFKNLMTCWDALAQNKSTSILIEANDQLIQANKKELKGADPKDFGMYYTLPIFLNENRSLFKNLSIDFCDHRTDQFFELKGFILKAEYIVAGLKKILEDNPRNWIESDAIQQNLKHSMLCMPSISTADFAAMFTHSHTIATQEASNTNHHPIIAQQFKHYATHLQIAKKNFESFFKNSSHCIETLYNTMETETQLNRYDQSNREQAFKCLDTIHSYLSQYNAQFEKDTNLVTDVGFLQKIMHNKGKNIVLFAGNNHTTEISSILQKILAADKSNDAIRVFTYGDAKLNYIPSKKIVAPAPLMTARLLTIPFNPSLNQEEIAKILSALNNADASRNEAIRNLANISAAYMCALCLKVSFDKNLQRCSRCKKSYYCNATCQKNDWSVHKATCK